MPMRHDATQIFALQVAVTRGLGGIVTAVRHYERMLARPGCDHRPEATCRFYGVRPLADATLVAFDNATADNARASELLLPEVAQQVWHHGNYALQRQVLKHQ